MCKTGAGGNYYAVIGRYDLDDTNVGDTVSVKTEVPHPYYNPSLTDNDFNLIFLTRETTANNVPLVALNTEGDVPSGGDPVEVMGWYVRYITLYDCCVCWLCD